MKDKELIKIQGLLKRLDEFESFFYSDANFSNGEIERMKKYIYERKKYLFKWMEE